MDRLPPSRLRAISKDHSIVRDRGNLASGGGVSTHKKSNHSMFSGSIPKKNRLVFAEQPVFGGNHQERQRMVGVSHSGVSVPEESGPGNLGFTGLEGQCQNRTPPWVGQRTRSIAPEGREVVSKLLFTGAKVGFLPGNGLVVDPTTRATSRSTVVIGSSVGQGRFTLFFDVVADQFF